ncbi:MAG TPA: succinate dehydrogenase assembly factor 2 [Gammaproteobacteria bacterium]|nr:succinate dehydrogenase assembly factor 2 [Gammaproteobacteria bacterium]
MQTQTRDFSRLYWQCRRGMLELDLLLQGFMERRYHLLTRPQQRAFEQLLATSDQLLLEYLMGRTVPIDTEVANIVQQIRKAAEDQG